MRQLIMVTLLMLSLVGNAKTREGASYLYFQGDKNTPFYVKVAGKMQPRYGKNYSIIPALTGGELQVEIMFQQNVLPAEKFTLQVPEHGGKGFLLAKNGDSYFLIDLSTKLHVLADINTKENR